MEYVILKKQNCNNSFTKLCFLDNYYTNDKNIFLNKFKKNKDFFLVCKNFQKEL